MSHRSKRQLLFGSARGSGISKSNSRHLDPELTAEGAQMARAFAEAHRSIVWTAAYVSPMKRTIATAKPLCDALGLGVAQGNDPNYSL